LTIEEVVSLGDTCADSEGSFKQDGVAHRCTYEKVRIAMTTDSAPIRLLAGTDTVMGRVRVDVNHTTTGSANAYDVEVRGDRCTLGDVVVVNHGAASWRAIGLWSGSGHIIRHVRCENVRVGIDARNAGAKI